MQNELHTMNSGNTWTKAEMESLGMMLTAIYNNLSTYGQPLNLKSRLGLWRMTLEEDYPMPRVLEALKRHCKQSPNMPTPADVEAILNPPKAKITQAEYIHAQKQHALEGYPMHGYYGQLIREYEAQEGEDRHAPLEIARDIKHLAGSVVKKIDTTPKNS